METVKPFSEYCKQVFTVDWFVENLFIVGGVSILVGDPKCGKSQLIRHLISSCLKSESFLGHKVNNCQKLMYLALEERGNFLVSYLKQNGISDDENRLLIGDGCWLSSANYNALEVEVRKHVPSLCIIDTYAAFSSVDDFNDFRKVYKSIQEITKLARDTNCHFIIVHHTNKGDAAGSKRVMGSQSFFASVDGLLILSSDNKNKKKLEVISRYVAHKNICFNMSPSELSDWKIAQDFESCEDALLDAVVKSHPEPYEFRKFKGYGEDLIQEAKANLIKKELVLSSGGKKGQPLMLNLKNTAAP